MKTSELKQACSSPPDPSAAPAPRRDSPGERAVVGIAAALGAGLSLTAREPQDKDS